MSEIVILGAHHNNNLGDRAIEYDQPRTVRLQVLLEDYADTAVVRRLYEAIRWRGLRNDNPAAGIKAPRDRTSPEERVKYLPPAGLEQLLVAPQGDGPLARRNRAILALMGVHGLRVAEVAGLDLEFGFNQSLYLGSEDNLLWLKNATKYEQIAPITVK